MPATVIIGAGVSGLQCAAAFLRLGHTVTVLEREEDVGGVWLRYTAFNVQVPREYFCFPDFTCPPELEPEEYPTGRSLLRYIIAYAHKNQLYRHIVFRATVTRLHRLSGQWQCFYDVGGGERGEPPAQHRVAADFVVVATGLHSLPNMPLVEGSHLFRGRLIHVQDLPPDDTELAAQLSGRRVVVIGGTKTAVDAASRIAGLGADETFVVYRQAHWPISRYPLRGIHFTRLFHSRLASYMLDPYHDAGLLGRTKGWITRPLRRLFWRSLERALIRQHRLAGDMLPSMPLDKDLLTGGLVHDGKWVQHLEDGSLHAIKDEPQRFTPDGLLLRSGSFLAVDVVVMATGHRKDYSFIDADILSKLGLQRDGLYLYRHVLPPLVRNIAFVGSETNSLNNPLTSYLQAKWLVACLQERVRLPSPQDMMGDLQRQTRWQRRKLPPQPDRASMVGIYAHHYHDRLLRDMGLQPRRKPSLWRECFEPYTAADYRFLATDLDGDRDNRAVAGQPSTSSGPSRAAGLVSAFKLPGAAAAAGASAAVGGLEGLEVAAGQHSVGFGVSPLGSTAFGVQQEAAAAAAAAAAAGTGTAGGGSRDGDVNVTEEGRCLSGTSSAAPRDSPGVGPPQPQYLSSSQLVASLSYGSRSGTGPMAASRLLGTLYEQEGGSSATAGAASANGHASAASRSGFGSWGPGQRLLSAAAPQQGATPPDTPVQPPYGTYVMPFRPVTRPTVYVPPSSGRSCLMDAASLALMDGVVGGALMDKPPRPGTVSLLSVGSGSGTGFGTTAKPTGGGSDASARAAPTAVLAAGLAAAGSPASSAKGFGAAAGGGGDSGGGGGGTSTLSPAPSAATPNTPARQESQRSDETPAAPAAAAAGASEAFGGASTAARAAAAASGGQSRSPPGVLRLSASFGDQPSTYVNPLAMPGCFTVPSRANKSVFASAPAPSATVAAAAVMAPYPRTPAADAAAAAVGSRSHSFSAAVGAGGGGSRGSSPLRKSSMDTGPGASAASAVAAAVERSHGSGASAIVGNVEGPQSSSDSSVNIASQSRNHGKPRTLIQLVTTRHQHQQQAASPLPGMNGGSDGAGNRGGSTTSGRGTTLSIRRTSDVLDESEDFVGTPPSCFTGLPEEMARDQAGVSASRVQSRQGRRHSYDEDDDDDDEQSGDDVEEEEFMGCLGRMDGDGIAARRRADGAGGGAAARRPLAVGSSTDTGIYGNGPSRRSAGRAGGPMPVIAPVLSRSDSDSDGEYSDEVSGARQCVSSEPLARVFTAEDVVAAARANVNGGASSDANGNGGGVGLGGGARTMTSIAAASRIAAATAAAAASGFYRNRVRGTMDSAMGPAAVRPLHSQQLPSPYKLPPNSRQHLPQAQPASAAPQPSTNTPSSALERYAARMTAAPTFRMSLTNMADMNPQNLKQAARAAAAAAAMAAAMGGGSTSIHSAPLHPLLLSAFSHQQQQAHMALASSRFGPPQRPRRVSEEVEEEAPEDGDEDMEVPAGVVMGGEYNDPGGYGGGWDADPDPDDAGAGAMSSLMLVGGADDESNLDPTNRPSGGGAGGEAVEHSCASNASCGGGGGGNGPAGRRPETSVGMVASEEREVVARGPGSVGPQPTKTRGGPGASAFTHFSGGFAMGTAGVDGGMAASPPGHGGVGAAAASSALLSSPLGLLSGPGAGSWDMTFKQLSRAVVAPPQRAPGVLRAAMISRRSLMLNDRPSETGAATPTGGSFFTAARRAAADDGAAAAVAAAGGGGSGSGGVQLGAQGFGAALAGGAAGAALLAAGGVGGGGCGPPLLGAGVQPSGPAMAPLREPAAASRFVASNNSSGKATRMQVESAPPRHTSRAGTTHDGGTSSPLSASPPSAGGSGNVPTVATPGSRGGSSAGAAPTAAGAGAGASSDGSAAATAAAAAVVVGSSSERSGHGTPGTRSHWASAVSTAKELRIQAESTRSAFAAVVMAARARRSSGLGLYQQHHHQQQQQPHESPMLAKLIAASQSHNGSATPGPGRGAGASSPFSPTPPGAALPFSASSPGCAGDSGPTAAAGVSDNHCGQLYSTGGSSTGVVSASGAPPPAPAPLAGTSRANWESVGAVARSFKRLGGLLLPGSPPSSGPAKSVLSDEPSGGGGGGAASGSNSGELARPVRRLRRMISSKRRSSELPFVGSGITTVEEDCETVGLPPLPPPSNCGAAAGGGPASSGGGGGGGGGSAAAIASLPSPVDAPSAELAAVVLGHVTSRRSAQGFYIGDLQPSSPRSGATS